MYFAFKSDHIFLLSDQNGALVRHISFQGKKIICSRVLNFYGNSFLVTVSARCIYFKDFTFLLDNIRFKIFKKNH